MWRDAHRQPLTPAGLSCCQACVRCPLALEAWAVMLISWQMAGKDHPKAMLRGDKHRTQRAFVPGPFWLSFAAAAATRFPPTLAQGLLRVRGRLTLLLLPITETGFTLISLGLFQKGAHPSLPCFSSRPCLSSSFSNGFWVCWVFLLPLNLGFAQGTVGLDSCQRWPQHRALPTRQRRRPPASAGPSSAPSGATHPKGAPGRGGSQPHNCPLVYWTE